MPNLLVLPKGNLKNPRPTQAITVTLTTPIPKNAIFPHWRLSRGFLCIRAGSKSRRGEDDAAQT